jgi:hypothetical protein
MRCIDCVRGGGPHYYATVNAGHLKPTKADNYKKNSYFK